MKKRFLLIACQIIVLFFLSQTALSQPTEFTYQGRLLSGGLPANGSHDFEFRLFSDSESNTQIGSKISLNAVNVNNGVFSVRLDFGNQFPGENRYLEIRVRQPGQDFFTVLNPLQAITSSPYAIKSLNAENANNSTVAAMAINSQQLGGVSANQFVLINDSRLSDARNPLPNSPNYIHNRTTLQSPGSFNISGNGTLGGILTANSVTATNSIGIGIGTPTSRLVIAGSGLFNTAGAARFDLFNTTANVSYFQNVLNDGRWQLGTGSQTRILIDTLGNVGIGQNPTAKLTVSGEVTTAGTDGGRFSANNPNNQSARVLLDWFNDGTNDFPRIRYGGNGQGSSNGFLIQGPGDNTKFAILNNGFVGIGTTSPQATLAVHDTFPKIQIFNRTGNLGFNQIVEQDGSLLFQTTGVGDVLVLTRRGNLGIGGMVPNDDTRLDVNGKMKIRTLGSVGTIHLCRNTSDEVATCTSNTSSIRYKENIDSFLSGKDLIRRLRPVTFNWKSDKTSDFGLIAEEVAEAEPLLTFKNEKGETEGVKYDRIGVVLINAVNEQQLEIESQQKQINEQEEIIRQQQAELTALKKLVCSQNPAAELCQPKN